MNENENGVLAPTTSISRLGSETVIERSSFVAEVQVYSLVQSLIRIEAALVSDAYDL